MMAVYVTSLRKAFRPVSMVKENMYTRINSLTMSVAGCGNSTPEMSATYGAHADSKTRIQQNLGLKSCIRLNEKIIFVPTYGKNKMKVIVKWALF